MLFYYFETLINGINIYNIYIFFSAKATQLIDIYIGYII